MMTVAARRSRVTLGFIVLLSAVMVAAGCRTGPPPTEEVSTTQTPASTTDGQLTTFSQEITSPTTKLEIRRGEKTTIPVTVKNTGPETWRFHNVKHPVVLSYKWFQQGKILPYEGERSAFPILELEPGGTVSFDATVLAPDTETGKMMLNITLVQEGVAWFISKGATPLRIDAVVK